MKPTRKNQSWGRKRSDKVSDRRKPHILYVDDDDTNREIMKLRLQKHYTLILAASDREACAVMRDRHAELDGILMDVELQGSELNGIELAKLFKGRLHDPRLPAYAMGLRTTAAPLFFVTAFDQELRQNDAVSESGGDGVFAKPVDFAELHRTLERALGGV